MIRSKDLSKAELISVLEVIESARTCSSEAGVYALLRRSKDLLGADYVISGTGSISGLDVSDIVSVVNGNYPDEFVDKYCTEHYYKSDPVVRQLSRFSSPQLWSDIFKTAEGSFTKDVVGAARDFGLRYGVSSGVYVPETGCINVFSFAGPMDTFTGHHIKILEALTLHLNKALVRSTEKQPSFGAKGGCHSGI